MIRSMVYKEWIKVRWMLLLYVLLAVLAVGYIFIRVRYNFTFNEAKNFWYSVLFQGYNWFKYLMYIPLVGGLALAVAQYFPETVNKRIKLTFHLPVEENRSLLLMMQFGTLCLLAAFLVVFLLFLGLSLVWFPKEIIWSAVVSVTPWFLGGFAAYYLGALIILEPVWLRRILYFLVAATFIPFFIKSSVPGGYGPAVLVLFLMTCLLSVSLLFSGYRFRKGEM
ncbi:MAG TPA: hypothetical protein PLX49_11140 [Prolixibacteraceae bacterium]|nr:hypothetical protein [Prolixibacteraceae bacterium]